MTGIFRSVFRPPRPVQSALATLSGAAQGGANLQPSHFANASSFPGHSLRFAVGASWLEGAQSFPSPAIRLTLKPAALGSGAVVTAPDVASGAGAIQPQAFASGQGFFAQSLRLTVKPASLTNAQIFFATNVSCRLSPAAHANATIFFGPRVILRLSAAAFVNAQAFGAPAVVQPGLNLAPFVSSAAQVFAPSVIGAHAVEVVGGGIGAGWGGDQPPRRARRKTAAWPNLPRVNDAPPWTPIVVTPEIARHRARVQMAWRKRMEQQRRKRDVDRRVSAIFDHLVEGEIARTLAMLRAAAR